jgi:pimeloyl-ACP methyl ester carboxylesterase
MNDTSMVEIDPQAHTESEALPLVLLPGTLCDARMFEPLLDRLSLTDRAVSHGGYVGARSIDEAIEGLLQTIPARAILFGFSLGGILALALARAAPDRIAAMILSNSTARPVDPVMHRDRRGEVERVRTEGMIAHVQTLLPRYLMDPSASHHAELILSMATVSADRFADQTELALSRPDARPWLHTLGMPVLVIGGGQDGINPPPVQIEMADALPASTLVLIEGSGHFTPLEQPEVLAAHVATWLGRVDATNFQTIKERQR